MIFEFFRKTDENDTIFYYFFAKAGRDKIFPEEKTTNIREFVTGFLQLLIS